MKNMHSFKSTNSERWRGSFCFSEVLINSVHWSISLTTSLYQRICLQPSDPDFLLTRQPNAWQDKTLPQKEVIKELDRDER